jgi:hypothetical protein
MSSNQSSHVRNGALTSEDLKTDSVPDTSRERDDETEENNESLAFPPKEEVTSEERQTGCESNPETNVRPQSYVSYGTKNKSTAKSTPQSSKYKKDKKKSSGVYLTNCVLI